MDINKKLSLKTRFAIVLIVLAASAAAVVAGILYANFQSELRASLRQRLHNIVALASLQQNGDDLSKVQAQNDTYFNRIQNVNAKIKFSDPDLRFVYTMRKDKDGIYFVVDARISPDEQQISNYGTRYLEPSPTLVDNFDTMLDVIIEQDFYDDEYGKFLSGYAPIFSSDGKRVGVLGMDISANTILKQEQNYLFRLIGIYLLTLPLFIILGIIFANYLAKPIVGLRDMANKISKGEFNTRITEMPRTRELAELARDLNIMTENLSELISDLEQRVADRTAGLTRKTEQLRAASYIARQTAEIQDLGAILESIVNLVTDQFGFYHAGIFLINEIGDEAILQAASSDGGKQMIENGYSLLVGMQGIVGHVASQKRPRIALDVGSDAVFFNNPYLPATRSEVAIPLTIRNKVLGVLDIQSDKPQAFSTEDIDVLETLADQVAIAIDNARLLDEFQTTLLQLEAVTTLRTRETWSQKLQEKGYTYTYTPLGLRAGKPAPSEEEAASVPINLRGQRIGAISINRRKNSRWNKVDEDLLAEVATQVGLAIDNIRLLEEATQRARQEQIVGELATRFSQSLDIDSLLQTAARELGQIPDISEVSVFISQMEADNEARPPRVKRRAG